MAHVLHTLNQRYQYGLHLHLLSIDEGITGYRDDSLAAVKRNQSVYGLPLQIMSYEQLYGGWRMDQVVQTIGKKNNCTYCGVFRRQALDRGAALIGADCIATGHNADDLAETVLMNLLRGDIARLSRCMDIKTVGSGEEALPSASTASGDSSNGSSNSITETGCFMPRCKPFKYAYEKEIVMYAYLKKLDYFSTECIYAPNAYRGHARTFLKQLESVRPGVILDIIFSGEFYAGQGIKEGVKMPVQGVCTRCGYIASNRLCKACVLLESLQRQKLEMGSNEGDNSADKSTEKSTEKSADKSTEKKSLNVSW